MSCGRVCDRCGTQNDAGAGNPDRAKEEEWNTSFLGTQEKLYQGKQDHRESLQKMPGTDGIFYPCEDTIHTFKHNTKGLAHLATPTVLCQNHANQEESYHFARHPAPHAINKAGVFATVRQD